MWLAALAQTLLVTLSTAQPGTPNEIPKPPPFFPAPEEIRITGIENATLTIKMPKGDGVVFESKPAMTADGPRVRLTVRGGITLEATRLRVQSGDRVITLEAVDGKIINASTERLPPADKPAPKPKQP